MTGLALRSLRHRAPASAATFLTVLLGALLIGSFAAVATAAGGPVSDTDTETLVTLGAVVGGWGTLIVLFSVVSTVGITVRQRQTEIGLLRTIGATPRQARRLVRAEVLAVAGLAAVLGAALSTLTGHGLLALLRGRMVEDDVAFRGGAPAPVATVALLVLTSALAAGIAGRRATRRPATLVVADAEEGGRLPWWRVAGGLLLMAYGVGGAVVTVTVTRNSDDPYAAMQTSGSAGILVGVGLAVLAPLALRWGAPLVRPLLGGGAAAHLAAVHTRRRSHLLAGVLGPTIVLVSAAVSVLMIDGIDARTLDASAVPEADAEAVTLLNYVVTGMLVLFAAIMVVNAFAAVLAGRRMELERLRLVGATPGQVRGTVMREAVVVAVLGIGLGLIGLARHGAAVRPGPRRGPGARRSAVAPAGGGRRRGGAHLGVGAGRAAARARPGRGGAVTDSTAMAVRDLVTPIGDVRPLVTPAREPLVQRLRLTLVSAGLAVLGIPVALALAILSLLMLPLSLTAVGLLLPLGVVPALAALTGVHRRLAEALLDAPVPTGYAPTAGRGPLPRLAVWLRDPARWRDVGFAFYSATGGFVLSVLPVALLTAPVTHLVGAVIDGGLWWWLLVLLDGPLLFAWWLTTPVLVRARVSADRGILGHARVEELERRVVEVTESRRETLDHGAAEIRRIERDLHDGAQARIAAVGMNVGLAEKLIATDPEAAAALLREARETTVVGAAGPARRGARHPPAVAGRHRARRRGLAALVVPLPLPVTVALDLPGRLPAPVESAAYFAVAECLTNTLKHAAAGRAWVSGRHDGQRLRLVVGDDGGGGAVAAPGGGLDGVARRLAAFDGTMRLDSPAGGPTVVTLEVPCPSPTPTQSR